MTPMRTLAERARWVLWWVLGLSAAVTALLVVLAAGEGYLRARRGQALLAFAGLAVASELAHFQLGKFRQRPKLVVLGLAGVLFSQACYFLLVWTGWKTQSLLWRLWWLSMVLSVHVTHLIALRAPRSRQPGLVERWTPWLSIAVALLFASLGVRRDLLSPVGPVYWWIIAVLSVLAVFGSLVIWGRWLRRQIDGAALTRKTKVWFIAVSHLVVLGLGLYVGRTGARKASLYEAMPSAMARLSPAAVDAQAGADLVRLRTVSRGLAELESKMDAFHKATRERFAKEGRDYYTPAEDEQLRWLFVEYLSHRTALMRLIATYAGFEAVRDPRARARCFMLGYAATTSAFRAGLRLVHTYRDRPVQRRKLNEAEPAWGIPAGMFDRIYANVANPRNHELCAEMAAYLDHKRSEWRRASIWPADDLEWLEGEIASSLAYIHEKRLSRHLAWIDLFIERVKEDAYTPAYAVQSMVAEWIGDTRIVQRQPCVSGEQIDKLAGKLKPGDILLERRNWFLSNAFLPGFWPHAALYVGTVDDLRRLGIADADPVKAKLAEYARPAADGHPHTIIEAVSEGVIFSSLHHSMSADHVAVLRPRLSDEQIAQAIVRAFRHEGKPYDFEFDFSTADRIVCTELVYRAYQGMLDFKLVRVMGRSTLPAIDIVRKFARERDKPECELDLVIFLDGDPATGKAVEADVGEFCASADRPREFHR